MRSSRRVACPTCDARPRRACRGLGGVSHVARVYRYLAALPVERAGVASLYVSVCGGEHCGGCVECADPLREVSA